MPDFVDVGRKEVGVMLLLGSASTAGVCNLFY